MTGVPMSVVLRDRYISRLRLALAAAEKLPEKENAISNAEDVLMGATEITGIREVLSEWGAEYAKAGFPKTAAILMAFSEYLAEVDTQLDKLWGEV